MKLTLTGALLASVTALAAPVFAQDNLTTMEGFKRTDGTFTYVDQVGQRAEALREDPAVHQRARRDSR